MPEPRKLRVFLCHSSNDKPAVRELYQRLKGEGWIEPWLDEEKLLPGQDWDLEIEKAVEATDAVIVFLSNNSVTKDGYIQRELRFVLRIADFKPEGTVFVIPLRLDDCPLPRRLSMWQYVDYFPDSRKDWAYQRLLGSLKVRAGKMGVPTVNPAEEQARHEGEEKAKREISKKEQEERERANLEEKTRKDREDQGRVIAEAREKKRIKSQKKKEEIRQKWVSVFQGNKRRSALILLLALASVVIFLYWPGINSLLGGSLLLPDTPTPLISPNLPASSIGLSWEAEQGEITVPFTVVNGVVSQSVLTDNPANGGRALYRFTVQDSGNYIVKAIVNAADAGSNSFFVGMDNEPDTSMIWDIVLTDGFEKRIVSWREEAAPDENASTTEALYLTPGEHTLIFRGREPGVLLDKIEVAKVPTTTPFNTSFTETVTPTNTPTKIRQTFTIQPTSTPTATATPTLGIGSTMISGEDKDSMVMVYVPAGEFEMGSNTGDFDEQPVHKIKLDAFWMAQTEVTNTMYSKCVLSEYCKEPYRTAFFYDAEYANHPVTYVSWNDASRYCEWAGARLSTEAEWEYAARGGLQGKDYPWGDTEPVCEKDAENGAKFNDSSHCKATGTELVGSYLPNEYGLYDVTGNVWEWVADIYDIDYYKYSPASNPTGPEKSNPVQGCGVGHIVRGGSWLNDSRTLRISNRQVSSCLFSYGQEIGFRCAKDASK